MASQLRVDKIVPVDGVPTNGGGGVIQVVQSVKNDVSSHDTTSGSDWVGHGLSVTITPKFSTSKILITGYMTLNLNYSETVWYKLFKGGSVITGAVGDQLGSSRARATGATYFQADEWANSQIHIEYLDTAGSTSALTYTPALSISTTSSGRTLYVNRPSSSTDNANYASYISTLTAMEISA